ncbi:unnamed protein product [Rotaria magnacalcarata]
MSNKLTLRRGSFFGIGNPLLDVSKEVDEEFLEKYKLKEGEAILAREEHAPLFRVLNKQGRLAIGGSSQNIMRTIVWILEQKLFASYMGCVGDDFEKQNLMELAQSAGLHVVYQTHPKLTTGRCAVLINTRDQHRTMVASQGASEGFTADFLDDAENWLKVEQAQILCSEGFFLVSCREAFMRVCEHAFKTGKIFTMTLSAKFICDNPIGVRLLSALPYADIVFGYEDEARILAKTQLNIQSNSLHNIIEAIRDTPKWNKDRPRIVVVSKIPERTTVATNGIKEYRWKKPSKIVDTHGCGDALAGGFLAYFALGKTIDQCINAALYCAYENLQQLGCQFPDKPSYNEQISYEKK